MRAIWKGSISFGLVNIPVKLYSAIDSSTLDLDMLDSRDHSRIRFKRVNEETGREVPYEEIVKGYKYDGDYIILSDKDIKSAAKEKSNTIDIFEFVNIKEIDSIYYEQPYYLEPDKGAEKPYALIREAMLKSGKAGVATFVMRTKEHLAVIKPRDKVIVLNRLRFYEEIRSVKDLKLPEKVKAKSKELDLAISLIDSMTDKFDISKYKDTYSSQLMKVIKAKAKGKSVKYGKLELVPTKVNDLMSQLKNSIKKSKLKKAS
jgi:DNA end-binding protein Ku